jgi:hypothetical protein
MWSTLNFHYIGDLLKDNGDWKKIEHIIKEQCTQPTIRRLTTNFHTAEIFFRHHYPNLLPQNTPLPPYPTFVIQQPNNNLTPLPMPKCTLYKNVLKLKLGKHVLVNGERHWKLGKPKRETVYHPPILSKDGDIAWKILHNKITTPQQLHRWNKRNTPDSPWCSGTSGTTAHMFLDCPSVIDFWNQLTKTLHKLLGPQQLQKKYILYGLPALHTTSQQIANYLIVLAKSSIYKTFLAAPNSTHQHAASYQRMFQLRLHFRLQPEMHHSI